MNLIMNYETGATGWKYSYRAGIMLDAFCAYYAKE